MDEQLQNGVTHDFEQSLNMVVQEERLIGKISAILFLYDPLHIGNKYDEYAEKIFERYEKKTTRKDFGIIILSVLKIQTKHTKIEQINKVTDILFSLIMESNV